MTDTLTSAGTDSTAAAEIPARRGAILVVEDVDDVRHGLAQLLELHGYLVEDARTGEEALEQMTNDPDTYALILLDLMLPGDISGRDLRMRQLESPALAGVPTIVITASELEPRDRMSLRPDGWLGKPFRFEDLLVFVKRYVVSEGSALQADAGDNPPEPGAPHPSR